MVIALLIIALNGGVAALTFGALAASVASASRAVMERRAAEYSYLTRARDAERARVTLAAITRDEARLQSFFITPANILSFVLALEANARESKISQSITFMPSAAKSDTTLNLRVTAEGAFPGLVKYMGLVENMPAYVALANISFQVKSRPSTTPDAPAAVTLVYDLTIATTQPITELNTIRP